MSARHILLLDSQSPRIETGSRLGDCSWKFFDKKRFSYYDLWFAPCRHAGNQTYIHNSFTTLSAPGILVSIPDPGVNIWTNTRYTYSLYGSRYTNGDKFYSRYFVSHGNYWIIISSEYQVLGAPTESECISILQYKHLLIRVKLRTFQLLFDLGTW